MNNGDIDKLINTEPKRLEKKWHINPETGFLLRAVYGKSERFRMHSHEFYEIFLTVSGTIIHYVNGEVEKLEPGCIVFMRPDDVHGYLYRGEERYDFVNLAIERECVEGMFAYIDGAVDTNRFTKPKLPPMLKLTKSETVSVLKKFDSLNAVDAYDIKAAKLKVRAVLFDIFVNYFARTHTKEESYMPLWLDETVRKMKKPENFIKGICRMVEISGKTQEHLARSIKKYTGMTLSHYINDLRVNYAANLLLNTNLSVTDICFDSGFGNVSSFYACFSEAYGLSPSKYRKQGR